MKRTGIILFAFLAIPLYAASPPLKTNDPATDEDFRDIYDKMATHTHDNDGSARISTSLVTASSITLNGLLYAGNPVGTVVMYVAATAPAGWVLCDGSSLSTTTYSRLYAVIGTTYGGSGGNFNVPDLRGVFPKGAGTTNRAAGKDASGNFYAGTLGAYSTDMMQGHHHSNKTYGTEHGTDIVDSTNAGAIGNGRVAFATGAGLGANDLVITDPITDGTNGAARTGHTTEPQSLGVTFIIYAGI